MPALIVYLGFYFVVLLLLLLLLLMLLCAQGEHQCNPSKYKSAR